MLLETASCEWVSGVFLMKGYRQKAGGGKGILASLGSGGVRAAVAGMARARRC